MKLSKIKSLMSINFLFFYFNKVLHTLFYYYLKMIYYEEVATNQSAKSEFKCFTCELQKTAYKVSIMKRSSQKK
jgi:hypothetical protein